MDFVDFAFLDPPDKFISPQIIILCKYKTADHSS